MEVTILCETGYALALRGMAYSFKDRAEDVEAWWLEKHDRAIARAPLLASMDGGHNKFLESMVVWIDIEASRAFWSEFDTYRAGVTKQSESTMHTLSKRPPSRADFEEGTSEAIIEVFARIWQQAKGDINVLKMNLPEGFLQRRLVCTNYKALRNIVAQRRNHRLKAWSVFCEALREQLIYPEFVDLPRAVTESEGGEL
jgi:hypothetical protein